MDSAAVRKWVAAYRIHGQSSVEKKRSYYSAAFKRSVLKHMRKHALSYRETAAYFDIRSIGCVGLWERRYDEGGVQALSPPPRKRSQKMEKFPSPASQARTDETRTREELLKEVNYLRMENAYLKKLDALMQANQLAQRKKRI